MPELRLSGKQERSIAHSTARINLWTGSIRSGKTIASLLRWLIYVPRAPRGGQLVVTGKTYDTVARNVFGPLMDPAITGAAASLIHYTRGASTATILGRQVEVITANDARAEGRLRGMTCAGAYGDEVSLLPEPFFDQLLGRMSVPGAKFFGTSNPDNPTHWLRQRFILRAAKLAARHWHFTLDDNPSLDPEYVERLKRQYTGLWYRRFIAGEWCLAEGAVYDCWDPDRHVIRGPLPPLIRLPGVGIDYGTTNPFAALMLGVTEDGRLCLTREWRWDSRRQMRALTDAEYSARLRAWIGDDRPEWICVDPSAASFSAQLFRDGLTPTAASNSVLDGIRLVASLLAQDALVVHESCAGWIDEITGYVWDPDASQLGEDKPIKADDHSLDAGRYVIATTEVLWRPLLRADLTAT